jgi:uncharacterized tellurite resistance protein B-like protein
MPSDTSQKIQELHQLLDELGAEEVLIVGPVAAAKLQNQPTEKLSPRDQEAADQFLAMLEAATLLAASNHELSEPEVVKLLSLFHDLSGGQIPEEHVEVWLDRFLMGLSREGIEMRLQKNAATLRDPDLRRSAFVMAVGLAYIDGEVDDQEIEAFTSLAKHYEIPMEEAQMLLEQVENDLLGPSSR